MATGIPGIKELKDSCPKSKGKFEGKAMVTWLYELLKKWGKLGIIIQETTIKSKNVNAFHATNLFLYPL